VAMDYLGSGLSDHPDNFDYTTIEHAAAVSELVYDLALDGSGDGAGLWRTHRDGDERRPFGSRPRRRARQHVVLSRPRWPRGRSAW
jgi:hypothetical protein